ncbi:MAG: DUF4126 domain-containing protein [Geoalkalibacter sp.]|jgi:hypothetical protein|uniref:DUF4126 domain-containing protein n=1 Tax=Geoalkalibacter sp. TaxID=3041440 RepID=UPI002A9D0A73|nr:DUF4126 domain-containing protein [Thermodesulfobacteriota bacterium]
MQELHQVVSVIALTMGVAWASGINLYAAILVLGLLGSSGNMTLPPDLQILTHPVVLMAAGFMYFVEFFADKTPGVDTSWDVLHTFIRIPAGAALAAGAVGDVDPAISLSAALIGGTLTAGVHATKAGGRVLINASPEPFSNWGASLAEDVGVVAGLLTALHYPWIFLGLLVVFLIVMIWLLPRIWRGVRRLTQMIANFFRARRPPGAHGEETEARLPPPQLPEAGKDKNSY